MSQRKISRRDFMRMGAMATTTALFVGCTPAVAPSGTTATTGQASAAQPAAGKQQIRFASFDWFAYVPGVKWDQYNQEQAFPEFQKEHPDVDILWEPHGQGWEEKVLTQMAAGTAPDIMSTWPPTINTWAEKKQLLNLQPMVDLDLPNADKLFYKSQWVQMRDPATEIRMGLLTDIDVTSVYYSKPAFEKAGLPVPTGEWTTDEYTNVAVKLTEKDSSGKVTRWGGQLRPDFVLGYFYYVEAFGGKVRDDETMMTCMLGDAPAQEALEWIRKGMWDLNCFGQDNQINATGIPNTWTGVLPAGIVAFAERSADQFFALSDSMDEGSWDLTHVPAGPKDHACMGSPDAWAVYKGVIDRGNQDIVWTMMKWLATSDYYQNNVAAQAGRIPGLLSAAQKWPDTLRNIDPKLKDVHLEVTLKQLETGEARGPQLFRYQAAADELLTPALQAIFTEGKAPVSSLQDVANQVTKAQQQAFERAKGS